MATAAPEATATQQQQQQQIQAAAMAPMTGTPREAAAAAAVGRRQRAGAVAPPNQDQYVYITRRRRQTPQAGMARARAVAAADPGPGRKRNAAKRNSAHITTANEKAALDSRAAAAEALEAPPGSMTDKLPSLSWKRPNGLNLSARLEPGASGADEATQTDKSGTTCAYYGRVGGRVGGWVSGGAATSGVGWCGQAGVSER